jgi:hypothetical protein
MIEDLIQQLAGGYWLEKLPTLRELVSRCVLNAKDVDELIAKALEEAKRNHKGRALNLVSLALVCNIKSAASSLRKRGILRASTFDLDHRIPAYIVGELIDHETALDLDQATSIYLRSCLGLLQAAPHFRAARESLRREIRRHPKSLLQGALAVVDFGYLTGNTGTGLSPEEFAEGCSYLLALQLETIGPINEALMPYEQEAATNGYYHGILERAFSVRRYYQFEIRVDEFDYRCRSLVGRELSIEPPNDDFEKSLRFGYINVEEQILKRIRGSSQISTASYDDFGHWFAQMEVFTRVEKPLPRIVMRFPVVEEFLRVFEGKLFREEIGIFDLAGHDLFVDPSTLAQQHIMGTLTVGDLLKVWRVVNLMVTSLREYFRPMLLTEPSICLRSLVPALSDEDFRTMLGELLGASKADEYIRQLRMGQVKNRDLIYQPLVRAGGYWHIPMNLIANSNFIRNALALSELRFHKTKDPLGALLAKACRDAGAQAWSDVGFKYEGHQGDIDCLALLDGVLFFFECKNALHPCGMFELRNTRQHLDKAATQIGRIDALFKDPGFRAYVSNKIGFDLPVSGSQSGAIVLGHRLFSGYKFKGFDVRSIHELIHFINDGDAVVLGKQIRVRPMGSLTALSMWEFLTGSEFHRRLFNAMIPYQMTWTLNILKIVEHTYRLDPERLAAEFGVNLPAIQSSADPKLADS